ncbi:MAG: hypothetical protein BGO31_07465 [Bacteroidetes bacterium 43-16]|nr:MAG: hypothetical protein BGO31_07465 [Bacteroidetes bacterium 43-16]
MSQETTISPNKPEELTDILLVLDKEKKKIQAVKGVDEKGNMKTVGPYKKNMGDFMKVDGHGNFLSNFFKNFISELKNPTNFSFFKVPAPKAAEVAKEMQKQVKNPTPEGEKMMQQYEVKPDVAKEQDKTVSETPNQQSAPKKDEYKYKVADIDWDTMNSLGLSKDYLEKKKLLEPLLKGYKSNVLVPVSLNLEGAALRTDARIWLQPGENGKPIVASQGVRKEPELKYPFFGHKFTDEDKKNLMATGNMGRVVHLTNSKTGDLIPSVISLDKLTNQLVARSTTLIKVPDVIKGIKLNDQQKQTLMEGKPLHIEGMTSTKGTPFDGTVQYNADKRYVEFLFENNKMHQGVKNSGEINTHEVPSKFRGKELEQDQRKLLGEGQSVYIDGLKDRKDKPYQGYITFNKENGKFDFKFPEPFKVEIKSVKFHETPIAAVPAEAHKTQVAVNSEGKTNEATKNIQEPLNPQQDKPNNQNQQDKQDLQNGNKQQETTAAPKKSRSPKL